VERYRGESLERDLHQRLRLRPGDEHVRSHLEIDREERAPPGDVGDGLAREAATKEVLEPRRLISGQGAVRLPEEPRARHAEHSRKQQLRIEAR
jgi:hypothetical protein